MYWKEVRMPKITVLMSVYKEPEVFVKQSIESILSQNFSDFEFLIYNDNPSDVVLDNLIQKYAVHDSRIKYDRNFQNIGLAATLNRGILAAKGELIARMDADDISMPERLSKQLDFMNSHPEIVVLGSWARVIDERNTVISKLKFKCSYNHIFVASLFFSYLVHPSVMIRRKYLLENKLFYDENFSCSQDYDLWIRILLNSGKITNIPIFLLDYRISEQQVSTRKRDIQINLTRDVCKKFIEKVLNVNLSDEQLDAHISLITNSVDISVYDKKVWLLWLIGQFNKNPNVRHLLLFLKKYSVFLLSCSKQTTLADLLSFQFAIGYFYVKPNLSLIYHRFIKS